MSLSLGSGVSGNLSLQVEEVFPSGGLEVCMSVSLRVHESVLWKGEVLVSEAWGSAP